MTTYTYTWDEFAEDFYDQSPTSDGFPSKTGNDITLKDTWSIINSHVDASYIQLVLSNYIDTIWSTTDAYLPLTYVYAIIEPGLGFKCDGIIHIKGTAAEFSQLPYNLSYLQLDWNSQGVEFETTDNAEVILTKAEADLIIEKDTSSPYADFMRFGSNTNVRVDNLSEGDLTLSYIQKISAIKVDTVKVSANNLNLTVAKTKALLSNTIAIEANGPISLNDVASEIESDLFTANHLTACAEIGITKINSTNGTLTLSKDKAWAVVNSGMTFNPVNTITLQDTETVIKQLAPPALTKLYQGRVDILDVTGASTLTLNKAQMTAIVFAGGETSGLKFHASDTIILQDNDTNLLQIPVWQLQKLKQAGLSQLKAWDGNLSLTVDQVKAVLSLGINFTTGDAITISDTGANIATLIDNYWIGLLQNRNVDTFNLTDNAMALSLQQARWVVQFGLKFATSDTITIQAHPAELAELDNDELLAFAQAKITVLDATSVNTLRVSLDQVQNAPVGVKYALEDEVIVELTDTQLNGLQDFVLSGFHNSKNVDSLDIADDALTLTAARATAITGTAKLGFVAGDAITVADTQAALQALTPEQLAAMGYRKVDALDSSDNKLVLSMAQAEAIGGSGLGLTATDEVTVSDTGAALSGLSAGHLAALSAQQVDRIDAKDDQISFSAAQAAALGAISLSVDDKVTLLDTGAGLAAISAAEISGVVAKGADVLDLSSTASLSLGQYQALTGLQFMAEDSFVVSGTAGADVATGQLTADTFKGLSGNDRLNGGIGDDRLWGGLGKDVLTGGVGKDVFVFDTKLSKKTNLDKIADFNVKDDSFWVENKIFKKLGKGTELKPGKLNKKFFTIGDKAKDANDYLVYNKKKGVLLYDQDGSGSKEAIEIATLSKNLKMTSKDFFII